MTEMNIVNDEDENNDNNIAKDNDKLKIMKTSKN